jgi:hypothetical protein
LTVERSPKQSVSPTSSFFEGAGFATLYVLPIANAFFKPWHVNAYHHAYPVGSIPRAIFFLTLLVWALASLAISVADRASARKSALIWSALTVALVWLLGRIAAGILNAHPVAAARVLVATHITMAATVVALLVLRIMRPALLGQIFNAARAFSTVSAFGMLILLPKLGLQGFQKEAAEQTAFTNPSLAMPAPGQPRIVWILLDELSYKVVFQHRPPGLTFPNLERFAQHSTSFSNLQPAGYYTELVIPSLILGQPVADVEHIYGRPFRYRSVDRGPWSPYDPQRTIFGEARRLGWTTGIAGWFNPYCRILPGVLDRCFWRDSDAYPMFQGPLYYERSTFRNLLALLRPQERMDPFAALPVDRVTRIHDYLKILPQAENLLRDTRIRFVMLHLPIPHPPGIYDRSRQSLGPTGNYIDNLVLADRTVGELMRVIQSTPGASETSVIVSSDHSWRVNYWKTISDWTSEEQQVSGGRFDPRPVLMVQLAGQDASRTIEQPTNAMVVHPILQGLLRNQIHSDDDLDRIAGSAPLRNTTAERRP